MQSADKSVIKSNIFVLYEAYFSGRSETKFPIKLKQNTYLKERNRKNNTTKTPLHSPST